MVQITKKVTLVAFSKSGEPALDDGTSVGERSIYAPSMPVYRFGGTRTRGFSLPVPVPPGELPGRPKIPPGYGGAGRVPEWAGSGKEGRGMGLAFS
jgi:hypothetical protein